MRYLLKVIMAVSVLFSLTLSAFAIEAPVNIQASNITETSITLNWDTVETAIGYHIYYSDIQGIDILTAQKAEYIDTTSYQIEGLQSNTPYYFILSAYDDIGGESIFSEELTFSTIGNVVVDLNAAQDFKLSSIEVLAQNQISLQFTSELDASEEALREIKVTKKGDDSYIYYVQETNIDPKDSTKLLVMFEENLPVSTDFTVTVIDILDKNGRNIESGIESFENFYIEESLLNIVVTSNLPVEVINESTIQNEDIITSNTGTTEEKIENQEILINNQAVTNIDPITGQAIASGDVAVDLNSAGADAKSLPKTGPAENIILLFLAMLLGFVILQTKRKA